MESLVGLFSVIFLYACLIQVNAKFSTCEGTYKKIGCYAGSASFTTQLLNYRTPKPGGNTIDWGDYAGTIHSLACECEKMTKEGGWKYFGLNFYGVCWSGDESFNPDTTPKSNTCLGPTYSICADGNKECCGTDLSSFVFKIADEPDTGVCTKAYDIGIALDSSSSLYLSDWEDVKKFVQSFIDSVLLGGKNTKISVMSFSTTAQIEIKFDGYANTDELKTKVGQLDYRGGFTRTDLALKLAKNTMFKPENGARSAASKVFILLTDGAVLGRDANVNWAESIIVPAKELKDSGVEVFGAGIGSDVSKAEMETIVSSPIADHLLIVDSFTAIKDAGQRFAAMTCGAKFENVALKKPTEQSSTLGNYYGKSAHAVDGNSDNRIYGRSCTRTNNEVNPWWRVDLEQERTVFEVKVVNRGDCCGSYLSGFQIRVGNSLTDNGNENPLCGENIPITTGETKRVACKEPMKGRYVNIRIPAKRTLTLCEVEVIAKV